MSQEIKELEPKSPISTLSESIEKLNAKMEEQLKLLEDIKNDNSDISDSLKSIRKPSVKKIRHSPEMHDYIMKKLQEYKRPPIIYVDNFKTQAPDAKEALEEYADSEKGYQTE